MLLDLQVIFRVESRVKVEELKTLMLDKMGTTSFQERT
jgi:hypothetical protein